MKYVPKTLTMCLYPRIIINKKYTKTKKNQGNIPTINDIRTKYVPIGCGKCIECMKKKSREWKVRLNEEIRTDKTGHMVTLTFNEESLNIFKQEFQKIHNQLIDNEIATRAIRLFLERWRKKYKKSIKHWLITEKGHKGTERIHIHGIIFTNKPTEIEKIWTYGYVYIGQWVNEQTINYIIKYVTKIDNDHKWFTGKIHCTPGLGKNYINRIDSNNNKFNQNDTNEMYKTRTGTKLPLPIYYRNKLYNEQEREQLWLNKLDKEERYVLGQKISVANPEGEKQYEKIRQIAREKNKRLGYGSIEWEAFKYNQMLKNVKKHKNIPEKNLTKNKKNSKLENNNTNSYNNGIELTPGTDFE